MYISKKNHPSGSYKAFRISYDLMFKYIPGEQSAHTHFAKKSNRYQPQQLLFL